MTAKSKQRGWPCGLALTVATWMALALVTSGCAIWGTHGTGSNPIIGEDRQHWYPAGQPVSVPATNNLAGLYVLSPAELSHMMGAP